MGEGGEKGTEGGDAGNWGYLYTWVILSVVNKIDFNVCGVLRVCDHAAQYVCR